MTEPPAHPTRSGELAERTPATTTVEDNRAKIAEAVAELPGLPEADPADRYHVRALTVLWLEADKTEHTRRAYYADLASWLSWCQRTGLDPLRARRADVDAWKATITVTGKDGSIRPAAPSSVARRLAGISSWYRYLQSNDATDVNPLSAVRRPKNATTTPLPALDETSTARLLDQAERTAHTIGSEAAWRDAALVTILFYTGLRVSGLTTARVRDLDQDAGHTILRYRKKGGAQDFVPLVPAALGPLHRYLAMRAAREGRPAHELTGPLLATCPHQYDGTKPGGRALVQRDVWNTLRRIAMQAGIPGAHTITPHTARRTTGTLLLAHDVPVQKVQDLLGHADIRTTRDRYDAHRHKLETSSVYTLAQILGDHRH